MENQKTSSQILQERKEYLQKCLEKIEEFRWKDKLFEMNSFVSNQIIRETEYQRTQQNMQDSLLSRLNTLKNVKLNSCNDSARRKKLTNDQYFTALKHLREDYEFVFSMTNQKKID